MSKLKSQQLREVCQEEDIDHSRLCRKKDLIERINEVRGARQTAVEDDDGEDEVELDVDVVNVDDSAARCYVFSNKSYSCEL